MSKKSEIEAWKGLAIGIVGKAVDDYKRVYLRTLKAEHKKRQALGDDNDDYTGIIPSQALAIQKFFYSKWFAFLCDFIPEQVIEALDRQVFEKFDRYLERENKNAKL